MRKLIVTELTVLFNMAGVFQFLPPGKRTRKQGQRSGTRRRRRRRRNARQSNLLLPSLHPRIMSDFPVIAFAAAEERRKRRKNVKWICLLLLCSHNRSVNNFSRASLRARTGSTRAKTGSNSASSGFAKAFQHTCINGSGFRSGA